MERLTTGLEDSSIEKLRELAGGERKVGAFLSMVTEWLWARKEQLEAAPLSTYELVPQRDAHVITASAALEKFEKEVQEQRNLGEKIERRLSSLEAAFTMLTEQKLDKLNEEARQLELKHKFTVGVAGQTQI